MNSFVLATNKIGREIDGLSLTINNNIINKIMSLPFKTFEYQIALKNVKLINHWRFWAL